MTIIRSVCTDDIDQLWDLIQQASYGLTTLQITKEQLTERVELSEFAFRKQTEKPAGEPYVFVMEDLTAGRICGISCIFSKVGGYEPFYHYRRVSQKRHCDALDKTTIVNQLVLTKIHDGPTEIGSLFLQPQYRGSGRGRLLSMSRFLFVAAHPKRFSNEFIAEMRGVVQEDGTCPFWEAIGKHFFEMEFPQADSLSTINKKFIENLMPEHPIYENMLSEETRSQIGLVHPHTEPALAMLRDEGFEVRDLIDIFDGGPVVHCSRDAINAVARSRPVPLIAIEESVNGEQQILANQNRQFRSLLTQAEFRDEGLVTTQVAALKLQVKIGDTVWCMRPAPSQSAPS